MGKLLFIGSAVADVVVRIPHMPASGENERVSSQQTNLGGCACNAYLTARKAGQAECTLFAPIGSGVWGQWVARALADRGIQTAAPRVDAESGCCYCLVEDSGERTFLSEHGAEYLFQREWFDTIDLSSYDGVYICGLEIGERTGEDIISALEAAPPKRLYFAPGPLVCRIQPEKMARVMALQPVMHLNEGEALAFTGVNEVEVAASIIHRVTAADVVITLGERGAYVLSDGFEGELPSHPAPVLDTIGAGDSHIGALMAAVADGASMKEAAAWANMVSAQVVQTSGAELTDTMWAMLRTQKP